MGKDNPEENPKTRDPKRDEATTTEEPHPERDPKAAKEIAAHAAANPSKKRAARLIALSVIGLGALGVAAWYATHAHLESTDDAQVEADVVAVPARVGGVVTKVNFVENQPVKAGDVLVELDDAQLKARLAQTEADLASASAQAAAADEDARVTETSARGQKSVAEASLAGAAVGITSNVDEVTQAEALVTSATAARNQAQLDLDRTKKLFESGALPKASLDQAQTGFDSADANLAQSKARLAMARANGSQAQARVLEAQARVGQTSAVDAQIASARARALVAHARVDLTKAQRDLAALDLSYTRIAAPKDGVASKKSVTVGQMLGPGQSVVMVVPTSGAWVVANFKETQVGKMKPGQPVTLDVDAYPGLELHGEVESLAQATGARFSLLPPDNATGNFTKVVQRVPVRIKLDAPADKPLRPGMSVEVSVNVR